MKLSYKRRSLEIETTKCIMGKQLWLAKWLYTSSEYPSVPLLPQPHPELPDYRRLGFGAAEKCSFCFVGSQIHFKIIACFIFRSWLSWTVHLFTSFWLLEVSNCLSIVSLEDKTYAFSSSRTSKFLVTLLGCSIAISLPSVLTQFCCFLYPLYSSFLNSCFAEVRPTNQIKYCLYIPEREHRQ